MRDKKDQRLNDLIAISDAFRTLAEHPAFAGDEPEFNKGGVGYEAHKLVVGLLARERANLMGPYVARLYGCIFHNVESFEVDDIGADLAYLMGAVLCGGRCQWSSSRPIVRVLKKLALGGTRTEQRLIDYTWKFIDVTKDVENSTKDTNAEHNQNHSDA